MTTSFMEVPKVYVVTMTFSKDAAWRSKRADWAPWSFQHRKNLLLLDRIGIKKRRKVFLLVILISLPTHCNILPVWCYYYLVPVCHKILFNPINIRIKIRFIHRIHTYTNLILKLQSTGLRETCISFFAC